MDNKDEIKIIELKESILEDVSPRHFNKIANLFRVNYSQDTFNEVVARFAEITYGSKDAEVSKIYFPVES